MTNTVDQSFAPYREAAAYLKSLLEEASAPLPVVGIICGSGLSGLSKTLSDAIVVDYSSIPGFPDHCSVAGHKGELVFGTMASGIVPTVCLRGRFHSYEGHDMNTVALPVRVMRCLGVKLLLVTNAAGGLNPDYNVGDIVNISDYFALPMLAGNNPLVGPNDDELGPRFPPTSNAFDPDLQEICTKAASTLGFSDFVRENGTYCFVSGPMYESKAECRFLRSIGGDSVGMSTVPEIVAAHHCGVRVMCLSLITNKVIVTGDEGPAASHGEVLDAVNKRSEQIQSLVKEVVELLSSSGYIAKIPDLPAVDLSLKADGSSKKSCLCPFNAALNAPGHCITMGCAMIAIGVIAGQMVLKRG
uniref:purine-nucleoside phosphorylase n=1 Tax=Trieres chinensis TaxID=1514140 RepID=A0A7S2EFA2_TRICV|mmetsp:Transcript_21202/g.42795  ORF Transcript_21202/g.42795 Transcript_21202/m.42795 type:complete len:358 (+) Transcript_21202:134-1207(+)|eukprot:CAMPEP_0183309158 /NCGR_PEP_ID=MMETSP0160_2-20130417/24187_1 /TAXON_ID=2839 ORGANISM="Odontella Sinensis, Strain Grunow 1884" /NCGR_SAMPLE_ID=MMETSP0160_2 /ASSEMBLY_ACC=CAM_ASM_000250 /LENGTH=357 /DNA_ID=CAMNT_0025473131 /DNA_START=124 /DNA_END=1197 /DNA_ORIENTATION=+